jgi:hypothetical protein
MRRRLFAGVSAVSIVLSLAAVGLWLILVYRQPPPPVLGFILLAFFAMGTIAVTVIPFLLLRNLLSAGDRRRRLSQGKCPNCCYDLTGNTSGVCPECGTPVPEKAELKA